MIHLPDDATIKKLLVWLLVFAFLVAAANVAYIIYAEQKTNNEEIALANQFLTYVQNGESDAADNIWPEVYTSMKNNSDFLESFSNVLFIVCNDYYINTYLNGQDSENLYEISRIFHSFINSEKFNESASAVLDDFMYEKITYQSFIEAENDFFFFSAYTSPHIPVLIDKGILLHDSRNTYNKAVEAAGIKDYSKAIEMMRTVSTFDVVYYPKSILKIDEYIHLLTEDVKNGS